MRYFLILIIILSIHNCYGIARKSRAFLQVATSCVLKKTLKQLKGPFAKHGDLIEKKLLTQMKQKYLQPTNNKYRNNSNFRQYYTKVMNMAHGSKDDNCSMCKRQEEMKAYRFDSTFRYLVAQNAGALP